MPKMPALVIGADGNILGCYWAFLEGTQQLRNYQTAEEMLPEAGRYVAAWRQHAARSWGRLLLQP